jgi:hypothetical protein
MYPLFKNLQDFAGDNRVPVTQCNARRRHGLSFDSRGYLVRNHMAGFGLRDIAAAGQSHHPKTNNVLSFKS